MGDEILYTVGDLDGFRLIEVFYPTVIDLSKLSSATARYLSIWQLDIPTVQLNDVTTTGVFDEIRSNVLVSMLRRNATRSNYWGSIYWIGDNTEFEPGLRDILETAGRDPNCIFRSRDDAIRALRAYIAEKHEEPPLLGQFDE